MKNARKPSLIVCLAVAFVLVSCQISAGGPTPPRQVSASTQTANELTEILKQVYDNPDPSGLITVTLTEAQLTSLLEQRFSKQDKPLLQNPQVLLQNNQIEIFGVVQTNIIKANAHLVLEVKTNQSGTLTANIKSIDLGPFPAPQSLAENISTFIDLTMQEAIGSSNKSISIENISITDGLMTIIGRRQ